ncbi:hypothetical protein CEP54_002230 [Fusarium duplospermum]|uniref:Uncharacterized protein n=1 Tax=Fusarium duplospermum TaxID=1325734 RepID=A0A428QWJ7_9HYPO|nr:hypothetical protein CEP54_002230 [Fusarium duplospermum]
MGKAITSAPCASEAASGLLLASGRLFTTATVGAGGGGGGENSSAPLALKVENHGLDTENGPGTFFS